MKRTSSDYMYVGLQLLLFVAYILNVDLIDINTNRVTNFIGISIAIIGVLTTLIALLQLNTNLSPFPSPKSNTTLITNGVYKFVRHPIYTGIILVTFGYGLYAYSLYKIIISVFLYTLFYFKSSYEEERLRTIFPDYELYQKINGRFFPKL